MKFEVRHSPPILATNIQMLKRDLLVLSFEGKEKSQSSRATRVAEFDSGENSQISRPSGTKWLNRFA